MPPAEAPTNTDKILAILKSPRGQDLTNAEIAKEVGCTPRHVHRVRAESEESRPKPAKPRANVEELQIDEINLDTNQGRLNFDPDTVAAFSSAMEQGAEFPPGVVFFDSEKYWLGDGLQRTQAAMLMRRETFPYEVREGNADDALLYSLSLEAHAEGEKAPVRRSTADKRNAVAEMLRHEKWSKYSARKIADHVGVDPKTVASVREELESGEEIPTCGQVVGSDGKTYKKPERKAGPTNGKLRDDDPDDGSDPEDDAGSIAAEGLSDEIDYLMGLKLYSDLPVKTRDGFATDALLYRACQVEMEALAAKLGRYKRVPAPGDPEPVFQYMAELFLKASHPRDWLRCAACKGKGCKSCWRRGYHS
jgi:predicted transcriptional regulator